MRFLFAPAVALTARLRFAAKFALVGGVMALALCYFAVQATVAQIHRLHQIDAEAAGTGLIADLVEWNKVLIEYRRIAITAAVGDAAVTGRLKAQAAVIDGVLGKLEADGRSAKGYFDLGAGLSGIREGWKTLRESVAALPLDGDFAQKAFAAHGREFSRLYRVMRDLGDLSGMALEPDEDLFYLGFALANNTPKVAGITVRILAYETLNVARGTLTPRDKLFYEVTDARLSDAFTLVDSQLSQAMKHPAVKALLAAPLDAVKQQNKVLAGMVREQFIRKDAITATQAEVAATARPAVDAAWALVDANMAAYRAVLAERRQEARLHLAWAAGLAIVTLLAVIWLFAGMYFSLTDGVQVLREVTADMAGGNLQRRARVASRDELAEVGARFNAMAEALAGVVSQVKDSAGQARDSSATLSEAAQQIARSSRLQSESAQSTVASVEQVSVSIGHVADNAVDAVSDSQAASHSADEGEQRMNAAVEEIRRVAASIERAAGNIAQFGERASEIGAIVGTIKGISDRTNLLALNAAIEAARAGEAGRGFAVVADEVRALAENTRQATDNIASVIAGVQAGVHQSIEEVSEGSKQVAAGVAQTVEAAKSLQQIRERALKSRSRIEEIASATQEQRAATEDIARHIERIARMAEENDHSIGGINDAAARLRDVAGALHAAVEKFRM
ncbi:MAG: methyl-accepting chemotaxis protein [Betaproteobacteria bacterium]|nr:methyl-accepting chemotaxis protein [Betaproteobacteria bacterium]